MTDLPTPAFAYAALGDTKLQAKIFAKGQEAKNHLGRGVIACGKALSEARDLIPHGQWGPWLAAEFGASQSTALRCLQVFERFGNSSRVTDLTSGVLYMLAAPSTPAAAVEAVLEQKDAGEPITTATVKEVVRQHRKPREQPTEPAGSPSSAVTAGPVNLPRLHQKLAGIAEIGADVDSARRDTRSLMRLYTRDPELQLAAAGLVGLIEQLDDVATYIQRQLWPEAECPACHGMRATVDGECQTCRGGGWATRQQINGSGRR